MVARRCPRRGSGCHPDGAGEATVDLIVHDSTLIEGMIEAAEQRRGEEVPRVVESGDVFVEVGEALASDLLPRVVVVSIENSLDVVKGEAGVLQHLHEHHTTHRRPLVAALPRHAGVGYRQLSAFVVPQRRRGDTDHLGDLPDRDAVISFHQPMMP